MGIAAVGKVGRHEARVCGVVGAVAGADIEGELDLAALVEALADFMLEVAAGGGSSGSNESWYGRETTQSRWKARAAADAAGGSGVVVYVGKDRMGGKADASDG